MSLANHRARIAISTIFLLNGLTLSAWVSRVPTIVGDLGMGTVGYTGFLAGLPILGWVAQATSKRCILIIVTMLCAVAAVLAPATEKFRRPTT